MTGLSAGYCHEISLSNPKRFVTVKDKSRKSVPRCSTRKTKKLAQISTERRRKTWNLLSRKFPTRVSTKDCWTPKDFTYIPRQLILTIFQMESETYRLKISHKTQSERSRNSTAFRSFVRVWRQIRKRDHFELFSSSKRQQEQENRGINQQSKETATVCTVSSAALEVKGTVDPSQ
jgi:hypothetical protein